MRPFSLFSAWLRRFHQRSIRRAVDDSGERRAHERRMATLRVQAAEVRRRAEEVRRRALEQEARMIGREMGQ